MGIKFRCPECDKKLHVKAFLAGKRGICPHCGGKVRIPTTSTLPTSSAKNTTKQAQQNAGNVDASASPRQQPLEPPETTPAALAKVTSTDANDDPIATAPNAVWYVRPPSGGQYGPAAGDLMRRWIDEGRVAPGALVWREGWDDWRQADDVFPRPTPEPVEAVVIDTDLPASGTPSPDPEPLDFAATHKPRYRKLHASPTRRGRNVALIIGLALLCVVLLGALIYVLSTQG